MASVPWLQTINPDEKRSPGISQHVKEWTAGLIHFLEQFENSPRELWVIFAMKSLESFAHFGLGYILVNYLSDNLGMDDVGAGWVYGGYGMLTSVIGILGAFLVDNLGVRVSLIAGSLVLLLARTALVFAHSGTVATVLLMTLFPLGSALAIPVMVLAVRRYTTDRNKSLAFSVFYVVMNVAGCAACLMINAVRHFTASPLHSSHHHTQAVYHLVLWIGSISSIALLVLAWTVREINVDNAGQVQNYSPRRGNPAKILREVASEAKFWRFLLLTLLFVGVRFILRHMEATFPKYMLHAFGQETPFELLLGLNAALIIFCVPLFAYIVDVNQIPVQDVLMLGALISGGSPFILFVSQTTSACVLWVVAVSAGEALWSPKLYEYSVMVAPEGREGAYLALASAPLFVSKILMGGATGHLLERYCPAEGQQNCQLMWLMIGLSTIVSPVLLLMLRTVIFRPEDITVEHAAIKSLISNYGATEPKKSSV